jgi:hypothetical protein
VVARLGRIILYTEFSISASYIHFIWAARKYFLVRLHLHYTNGSPLLRECIVLSPSTIFLNAYRKLCSVRVFSTACESASITSILWKWQTFSCIFNRGNGWLISRNMIWMLCHYMLKTRRPEFKSWFWRSNLFFVSLSERFCGTASHPCRRPSMRNR